MNSYRIMRGEEHDLDLVRPLWEELNRIHGELSVHFRDRYDKMYWERRKSDLLKKSAEVMLEYAVDENSGELAGYCISSVEKSDPSMGEIDSILIAEKYRGSGLGREFMENALQWLDEKGVETKRLMVSVGNEKVLDFYGLFDFYPLHMILQQITGK